MLIVLGGLPGTGKTSLARALARMLRAVYVRIDTVEQALVDSGVAIRPLGPAGYVVGYALAADNLRLGLPVVADSVNPLAVTRDAWRAVGERMGVQVVEVEVICSDPSEHRRRVESRAADIEGLPLPTWQDVLARDYENWAREHVVIDTAGQPLERSIGAVMDKLRDQMPKLR